MLYREQQEHTFKLNFKLFYIKTFVHNIKFIYETETPNGRPQTT